MHGAHLPDQVSQLVAFSLVAVGFPGHRVLGERPCRRDPLENREESLSAPLRAVLSTAN